jgi:hypothetical protein
VYLYRVIYYIKVDSISYPNSSGEFETLEEALSLKQQIIDEEDTSGYIKKENINTSVVEIIEGWQ